jgi:hypothetical protein
MIWLEIGRVLNICSSLQEQQATSDWYARIPTRKVTSNHAHRSEPRRLPSVTDPGTSNSMTKHYYYNPTKQCHVLCEPALQYQSHPPPASPSYPCTTSLSRTPRTPNPPYPPMTMLCFHDLAICSTRQRVYAGDIRALGSPHSGLGLVSVARSPSCSLLVLSKDRCTNLHGCV